MPIATIVVNCFAARNNFNDPTKRGWLSQNYTQNLADSDVHPQDLKSISQTINAISRNQKHRYVSFVLVYLNSAVILMKKDLLFWILWYNYVAF